MFNQKSHIVSEKQESWAGGSLFECDPRRFGDTQKDPTEIWEDNASCIMMSENPTNRQDQDLSMSRYTIFVTWFETAM